MSKNKEITFSNNVLKRNWQSRSAIWKGKEREREREKERERERERELLLLF